MSSEADLAQQKRSSAGDVDGSRTDADDESNKRLKSSRSSVERDTNGHEHAGRKKSVSIVGHDSMSDHNGSGKLDVESENPDSVSTETVSQAIHGMDQKHMIKLLEDIYQLRMPKDFFDFWDFCCRTNPMNPRMALSGVNVELVGPFDILAGDVNQNSLDMAKLQELAMLHWRYYYDVPEFQTCLKVNQESSQIHYGYFRDDPNQLPAFVARNDAAKDCKIFEHGGNLFAAVHHLIKTALNKSTSEEDKKVLSELDEIIRLHAEKFKHSLASTVDTRHHRPAVASLTLHGAGFVGKKEGDQKHSIEELHNVSPDGVHRLLKEECDSKNHNDDSEEKKSKHSVHGLAGLIKNVEKDMEKGIFDSTLELGIDMFCYGNTLDSQAKELMVKGYESLGRNLFAKIAAKHLEHRVHGDQLSKFPMK